MALCGGNGMGFVNTDARLRATGFPTPDDMPPGPVTFLSHSGSAFAALRVQRSSGSRFNLIVSSGQEIVTTMDEYLSYALDLESTKVVALLLETVRHPDGFVAALAKANERDVPVLALKVGRTEGSKQMVVAHSGALAGEHGAYEAVFDAYGVHECRDLEEIADAIELFSSPRRVAGGTGIASLHDSGGERALFVDLASDLGVPLARISEATRERIDAVLDPGSRRREPAGCLGDRDRRRPDLHGELPGAARRSGDRRGRVRRGPHSARRAVRRGVPPGRDGRLRGHDEAVLRDVEPARRDRARRGRAGSGVRASRCSREPCPAYAR